MLWYGVIYGVGLVLLDVFEVSELLRLRQLLFVVHRLRVGVLTLRELLPSELLAVDAGICLHLEDLALPRGPGGFLRKAQVVVVGDSVSLVAAIQGMLGLVLLDMLPLILQPFVGSPGVDLFLRGKHVLAGGLASALRREAPGDLSRIAVLGGSLSGRSFVTRPTNARDASCAVEGELSRPHDHGVAEGSHEGVQDGFALHWLARQVHCDPCARACGPRRGLSWLVVGFSGLELAPARFCF